MLLSALIIGAAGWMVMRDSDDPLAQFPIQAAVSPAALKERARPPGPAQSPLPLKSSPQSEGWRAMDEKFRHAPSLRAFFYAAIQRPKEGGYFYALAAMNACEALDKKKSQPQSAAAQAAASALRMRCDFTEQDLADGFREFAAIRDINYRDDPLLGSMVDAVVAQNESERLAVFGAAVDMANPSVVGSFVMPHLESQVQALGGDQSKLNDDTRFALDLVECQLGADCGQDSARALSLCISREWCGTSVPEALRKGLGPKFDSLNAVATQLVSNIKQRALGRVLAPKKHHAELTLSTEH
jgi:hypothetical protein